MDMQRSINWRQEFITTAKANSFKILRIQLNGSDLFLPLKDHWKLILRSLLNELFELSATQALSFIQSKLMIVT